MIQLVYFINLVVVIQLVYFTNLVVVIQLVYFTNLVVVIQLVYFTNLVVVIQLVSGRGQVFVAKQKYDAIGNRSNRVLSFDKGEELEVLNSNPNVEWWEVRGRHFILLQLSWKCF